MPRMANDQRREEKAREAPVHFELYRRIKNYVESKNADELVEFSKLVPEKDVPGIGSADLVLERTDSPAPFLVIEVKKKTPESMLVFDDDPRKQALGYANKLNAHFYSISDGDSFRLFRTGSDKHIGDYSIALTEDFAEKLLNGLRDIYAGTSSSLPFASIEAPLEKVRQSTTALGRMLLNVFEGLKRDEVVNIKQEGRVTHVSVGNIGSILRLGLYPPEKADEDYIDVRLELLRKAFGERFRDVVADLSDVSGFEWMMDGYWKTEHNKWRKLKSIAVQDPNLDQTALGLSRWLKQLQSDKSLSASAG
jgi:hypothetical protein